MASAEKTTVRKIRTAAPTAQADALTQADEYDSIFGNTPLELDNGDVLMVPPHPDYGMLDDEKMEEWDQLQFAVDTEYDRHPDIYIPQQTMTNEDSGLALTLPAETKRGDLMVPFRKNKVLVTPPHSVKVAMIALGEDGYKKLKDGGRNASDVWKIWGRQSMLVKERQQRDTFRARGGVDMAAVPETDS